MDCRLTGLRLILSDWHVLVIPTVHARGRRHLDPDQEEVFVPLRGTLTMLLGDPWERVDVEPGGVLVVHPGTPLQMRNETGEEILVFVYGAPTRHGNAEFLADVESL